MNRAWTILVNPAASTSQSLRRLDADIADSVFKYVFQAPYSLGLSADKVVREQQVDRYLTLVLRSSLQGRLAVIDPVNTYSLAEVGVYDKDLASPFDVLALDLEDGVWLEPVYLQAWKNVACPVDRVAAAVLNYVERGLR